MNKIAAENAIRDLLIAIGENPHRGELKKTPERVAEFLKSIVDAKKDIKNVLQITHNIKHDEMVVVKDVPFYSLCEHHLLPFFGKCHLAYIPENNRVVGISRLAEAVDIMSKNFQVQERLTTDIANAIMKHLKPKGVGVVIEGRHLCMEMTGMKQPDTKIITSAVRGIFRTDIKTREEFLKLIR